MRLGFGRIGQGTTGEDDRLKDLLDRERQRDREISNILGSLDSLEQGRGRPHRFRRLLLLASVAGAAYVAGSAAGRSRYEHLRDTVRGWREGLTEPRDPAEGSIGSRTAAAIR